MLVKHEALQELDVLHNLAKLRLKPTGYDPEPVKRNWRFVKPDSFAKLIGK